MKRKKVKRGKKTVIALAAVAIAAAVILVIMSQAKPATDKTNGKPILPDSASGQLTGLPPGTTAKLGTVLIEDKTIAYRQAQDECYSGRKSDRVTALVEVSTQALERAVLEMAFGLEPPRDAVEEQARQVDANTRAPAILECVKGAYGADRDAYLEWYIAPTLINPKLHEAFSTSAEINAEEKAAIERAWKNINEGGQALEAQQGYGVADYPKFSPDLPAELQGVATQQDPFVTQILDKLQPGQLWPNIIETDASYQIVRLISTNSTHYRYGAVTIGKKSFGPWYDSYIKRNIRLQIADAGLRQELRERYPESLLDQMAG